MYDTSVMIADGKGRLCPLWENDRIPLLFWNSKHPDLCQFPFSFTITVFVVIHIVIIAASQDSCIHAIEWRFSNHSELRKGIENYYKQLKTSSFPPLLGVMTLAWVSQNYCTNQSLPSPHLQRSQFQYFIDSHWFAWTRGIVSRSGRLARRMWCPSSRAVLWAH